MFTILINSVFDALYVSLWICVIGVQFYNEVISPLKNEINDLKVRSTELISNPVTTSIALSKHSCMSHGMFMLEKYMANRE